MTEKAVSTFLISMKNRQVNTQKCQRREIRGGLWECRDGVPKEMRREEERCKDLVESFKKLNMGSFIMTEKEGGSLERE